ncbi:MAG: hypothetical protein JZU52_12725 [Lamprocystis purpurea]|jgi:hypothetical protein|uniref:hypothetical protein n=1 Tax=Lamprocystis purpurea TaxID=61598 RepID=UPI00036BCB3F|nr:hypothetical protein [Lamprocystis purpurea]MBV5274460.1 hypothetical protein [Lamprocystis purpurea]
MIRLSPRARPEAWTTIDINLDGTPTPLRVRYWLLTPVAAAEFAAERLKGFAALKAETPEGLDFLLHELAPDQLATVRALLLERVIDWDLVDADTGEALALTPESLSAVLDHGAFFRPLFQGLLDASSGAARKNA